MRLDVKQKEKIPLEKKPGNLPCFSLSFTKDFNNVSNIQYQYNTKVCNQISEI